MKEAFQMVQRCFLPCLFDGVFGCLSVLLFVFHV